MIKSSSCMRCLNVTLFAYFAFTTFFISCCILSVEFGYRPQRVYVSYYRMQNLKTTIYLQSFKWIFPHYVRRYFSIVDYNLLYPSIHCNVQTHFNKIKTRKIDWFHNNYLRFYVSLLYQKIFTHKSSFKYTV